MFSQTEKATQIKIPQCIDLSQKCWWPRAPTAAAKQFTKRRPKHCML